MAVGYTQRPSLLSYGSKVGPGQKEKNNESNGRNYSPAGRLHVDAAAVVVRFPVVDGARDAGR